MTLKVRLRGSSLKTLHFMSKYFRNHEEPKIWFAEPKSTFLDSVESAFKEGMLGQVATGRFFITNIGLDN